MKRMVIILMILLLFTITTSAQQPDSLWSGKFTPAGVNGPVRALAWDFSRMLVGGDFRSLTGNIDFAGGLLRWHFLSEYIEFITPATENQSDVINDIVKIENQDLTIVGGDFNIYSSDYDINHIALLDSSDTWHTLSGDSTDGFNGPVHCLLWVQDKLYIGGEFTEVAGMQAHGFVMWDQTNGFTVPSSQIEQGFFSGAVHALQKAGPTSSADIVVGGSFNSVGALSVDNIAIYDPQLDTWIAPVGGGVDGTVYALGLNDGLASNYYSVVVGGNFSNAGSIATENIAIYDTFNEEWKVLVNGGGTNGTVYAINFPSGGVINANQILIGGAFDTTDGFETGPLVGYSLAADEWRDMNIDIHGTVYEISDGRYSQYLAIGGAFEFIEDSVYVNNVFMLGIDDVSSDTTWYPTGYAPVDYGNPDVGITDVAVDDSGNVYIVGGCDFAGGTKLNGVGMYDGDRWYALGDGLNQSPIRIAVTGDTVYVAGSFDSASGIPADGIAMWNGSSWEALGLGLPFGSVRAMEVDLDGNLWVGGFIDSAGTIPVTGVAVWDGTQWTRPGDTLYRSGSASPAIFDFHVDTSNGDVWAVGQISGFGNIASNGAIRWDGSGWNYAGGSIGSPRSIVEGPEGNLVIASQATGNDLFHRVNGEWFEYAGGASVSGGSVMTYGCDLYLGGDPLSNVNGQDVGPIARWNGVVWDSLTTVNDISESGVMGIAVAKEQLIVVGSFRTAGSNDNISKGFAIYDGLRPKGVIPNFSISEPDPGDTLTYGDWYEFEWIYNDTNAIEHIVVEISYDSGATWEPIHSRAPIEWGVLPWVVPDTNVSHCKIRLSDALSPCATYTPDYTFVIYSDPAVESWWLTHKANTYWREPFIPKYNGFTFSNSKGNMWPDTLADSIDYTDFPEPPDTIENFPPWELFAEAFGDDYCYKNGNPNRIRPQALKKWQGILLRWGGSCLGFSKSSLLWFYSFGFNSEIFVPYQRLVNLGQTNFTRNMCNKHWIYQNGYKHTIQNKDASSLPVYETLDLIRNSFDTGYARTLSFTWKSEREKLDEDSVIVDTIYRTAAHNVVPYHVKNIPDTPGVYYMFYYDSNDPLSSNQMVRIDSINGTWLNTNYYPNDTNSRFMPRFPINEYVGLAPDDKLTTNPLKSASGHFAEVFTSATEEVLISDSSGNQVGFVDNEEVINNLDAAPIFPDDPDYQYNYPQGYILPAGVYDVSLSKFEGVDTKFSWFDGDTLVHVYERMSPDSLENDVLTMSEALAVQNPDTSSKTVSLTTIKTFGSSDRFVQINDWTMEQNDASSIMLDSSSNVLLTNSGSAKEYTVVLWNSGDTADSYTQSLVPIPIGVDANHKLLPNWELLESGSLNIAVDADNNGIYEDTIVADVATDIADETDNLLPDQFVLHQNYPNPFNPTTTISFNLPTRSDVRLVVYNVLGQKVNTLLDKPMPAGNHQVEWNGKSESGRSVSTGIYFYRIQTDDYTASKKMLLLK